LSFLGNGAHKAKLVRDDSADGATVRIEDTSHKQGDSLTLEMHAGGGFVGRFSKP
jgi:alpha-glucosidase